MAAVGTLSTHLHTLRRCSAQPPVNAATDRKQPTLLAHYMPWYVTQPSFGLHWTGPSKQHDPAQQDAAGRPDIWSHFHPLIGVYDSADPHVIECHLLQMKLAGIDGVIVDWYGISDFVDYPRIHEAAQEVFRATQRLQMQFAVCYEDRTIERLVEKGKLQQDAIPKHLADTLQWLDRNWFAGPNYVHVGKRPLLLNFGPIFVKDPEPWRVAIRDISPRPRFFALHHRWRDAQADGGFAWVFPAIWSDASDSAAVHRSLATKLNAISSNPREVIPSALPGFKDVYESSYPEVAYRDGDTLRESLHVALSGRWPIVQLVTWNDYGEGTMIEPTHEFGYLFLEIIQQARRDSVGGGIAFKADHLRLPARLLKLRKSNASENQDLDQISRLLVQGQTGEAEAALDRIAGARPGRSDESRSRRPSRIGGQAAETATARLKVKSRQEGGDGAPASSITFVR